jgi:Asp-tRNA(Asn)/Glu-tRNA(Gln) amidotransferase A subunit family amidase
VSAGPGLAALGAAAAARAVAAGRLRARELVDACLARTRALEPRVRAWVTVDAEGARACADALDAEIARGERRGPLHGVPIGVKDVFFTRGLHTRAGSPLLADFVPDFDASAVARLRAAGAIVLGKTTTTEFAVFDPCETRNPWNLAHTPGGSSSGSAAAVACRMVPAALGTQTGGSISRPAAYCGVVGLKPGFARIPVDGVFPVAPSLDHVGVLARSVEDAALLFAVLAGEPPGRPDADAAHPFRLGVLEALVAPADDVVQESTQAAVEKLRGAGAAVAQAALAGDLEDVLASHAIVMAAETAATHAERFGRHRDRFGPGIRALIERGQGVSAHHLERARRHQAEFRLRQLECLRGFDALVCASAPGLAPAGLASTGPPTLNSPWSFAGFPTVVLPTGTRGGLPTSIQLVGRPLAEAALLGVAAWCERVLDFREAPDPERGSDPVAAS